jgi:hypothetical protein
MLAKIIKYFFMGAIIGGAGAALKVPGHFIAFVFIVIFVVDIFNYFGRQRES